MGKAMGKVKKSNMCEVKVSVVVPVYNVEKYLNKCVYSVINQTYENIELILINDGSTDSSGKICDEFLEQYPERISVLHIENSGQAYARNLALKMCKGEYVTFLDSDDYFDIDYVQHFVNIAETEGLDIVCGGQRKVNKEGCIVKELSYPVEKNKNTVLRRLNMSGKLYKLEYLKKHNIDFPSGKLYEDNVFNLKAIFLTTKYKIIGYNGYNQLIREGSTTSMKIESSIIPYAELYTTLNDILETIGIEEREKLEFTIISFFTYFIFLATKTHGYLKLSKNRKSNSIVVMEFCDYAVKILEDLFPSYNSNKYLGLLKSKDLQLSQRVGTYIFVRLVKFRLLNKCAQIYHIF